MNPFGFKMGCGTRGASRCTRGRVRSPESKAWGAHEPRVSRSAPSPTVPFENSAGLTVSLALLTRLMSFVGSHSGGECNQAPRNRRGKILANGHGRAFRHKNRLLHISSGMRVCHFVTLRTHLLCAKILFPLAAHRQCVGLPDNQMRPKLLAMQGSCGRDTKDKNEFPIPKYHEMLLPALAPLS